MTQEGSASDAEHIAKAREMVARNRAAWDGCAFSVYADRLLEFADALEALEAKCERHRQMEAKLGSLSEALTGLAEAVRMYREARHPEVGAVTMTGSEAAMYQAMHHSLGVLESFRHEAGSEASESSNRKGTGRVHP